jgi:peptide-methionine (S)-S-oxide reductase
MEKAMFGAGCFWGIQVTFQKLDGVESTSVGYSAGDTENPTYEQVCTGTTNHAEVVLVNYDPTIISYQELLDTFWKCHNPTELNRQGPDVGTQYRSEIFTYSDAQFDAALASKNALEESNILGGPIATKITKAGTFYAAEDYHQHYLEKRGLATCHT